MRTKSCCSVVGTAIAIIVALSMFFPIAVSDIDGGSYIEVNSKALSIYVPHTPIRIDSNSDFAVFGFTGSGTEADPWVIENYEINGTGYGYCIYIGNTTEYFVVRNCYLHEASGGYYSPPYYTDSGLIIYNVRNGIVVNNIVSPNNFYGIYIESSNHNNIDNNTVSHNKNGIFLQSSINNTLTNNNASNNIYDDISNASGLGFGIGLLSSDDNIIINNYLFDNNFYGIYSKNSERNTISNNSARNNWYGIHLKYSSHNNINNFTLSNNEYGIYVQSSHDNKFINNIVSSNHDWGVQLSSSNNNIFYNNTVDSNINADFCFVYSNNNTLFNNNILNSWYGISIASSNPSSNYNLIYHNNIINNTNQAYGAGDNFWDNGYPSGGNYWSDYNGVDIYSGSAQDQPGSDGIGDSNYTDIDGPVNAVDEYPLMSPFNYTEFDIPLHQGWNLISLPVRQLNESIDAILESIDGKWDHILVYDSTDPDHWKTNEIFKPDQWNDLKTLNHKIGVWINITEPNVTLIVKGYLSNSTTIPLYAGWNLVGYPTLNDTMTVANAFWGTGADRVETFDAMNPYLISEVGPTYIMKPGEGYWVHVPSDTTWIIDW